MARITHKDAAGEAPRKLQTKVVLAITAIVAAGVSALTIDSALALSTASNAADEREVTAIAETFSQSLAALGELDPEDVQQRVEELKETHGLEQVRVYTIDSDSGDVVVLADDAGDAIGNTLRSDRPEAQSLLGGVTAYNQDECNTGDPCGVALASAPVPGPSVGVQVAKNILESQDAVSRSQRRAAVWVLLLTLLIAGVLGWMLRNMVFHPLRQVQFAMHSLLAGRTERRVEWPHYDEIGVLAADVDAMADRLRASNDSLRDLALEDDLTGLPNRRAGMNQLTAEVASSQREGKPVAVVVFDVDGLGEINERYGQEAGDETLRKLADAARLSLRPSDVCARLDDDKFFLILRGADARAAHVALDRLREVMTRIRVGPTGGARISFGVVESWADTDPEELLRRAEDEWARQKEGSGRRSRY